MHRVDNLEKPKQSPAIAELYNITPTPITCYSITVTVFPLAGNILTGMTVKPVEKAISMYITTGVPGNLDNTVHNKYNRGRTGTVDS